MSSRDMQRRSAAEIDRDARQEAERLKALLGAQLPWSRDVEAARQKCRSLHLLILFAHPLSTYAQSLDALWHQTTYLLIQAYRELVASLERSVVQGQDQGAGRLNRRGGGHGAGGGNPVQAELKKGLTRFRQALASEETFYRNLISRIVRFYALTNDCRDYLAEAKIPLGHRDGFQDREGGDELQSRSPSAFGPGPTLSAEEKNAKLALVYKALISLGDIERYKEQYGESQHRRIQTQSKGQVGRGEEKFANAKRYYEIARALQPDDGAAFNQLAVISTYVGDDFATTYNYFRALAIRNAFRGADAILYKFLGKATDRWRGKQKELQEHEEDEVDKFREEVVALVGVLYTKAGFTFIPVLQKSILDRLTEMLRSRRLGAEHIVKLTTIVIGSHHRARSTAGIEEDPKLLDRSHEAESKALEFLLAVFTVLLNVGADEVEEAQAALRQQSALVDEGDEDDAMDVTDTLPQYISAVLRRILPSLRLVSRWTKLDLEYLSRAPLTTDSNTSGDASLPLFLESYKRFIASIAAVFPLAHLPSLDEPLEEDLDMRGFAPLQRGSSHGSYGAEGSAAADTNPNGDAVSGLEAGAGREVHPNEEQLMRLADLQVDAKLILQTELGASLLGLSLPISSIAGVGLLAASASERDEDGDLASVSTETEDDPVNLAMRATLGPGSSTDGESVSGLDEVLRYGAPPVVPVTATAPPLAGNATPSRPKATALDLLQNLMLESSPSPSSTPPAHVASPLHPSLVTAPPGHTSQGSGSGNTLLFGATGSGPTNTNIWTMTREESEKGKRRASGVGAGGSGTAAANIAALWSSSTDAPSNSNTGVAAYPSPLPGYPYTSSTTIPNGSSTYSAPTSSHINQPNPSYPAAPSNPAPTTSPWGPAGNVPYPSYGAFSHMPHSNANMGAVPAGSGEVPYYAQAAYYGQGAAHYGPGGWNGAQAP